MSDKTYAETQGEAPFDWWKAIDNPPRINSVAHELLMQKSKSWATCACGNQCAIIPRLDDEDQGRPIDGKLLDLGARFHSYVVSCEWMRAKNILSLIEERSGILIAEELSKLNTAP